MDVVTLALAKKYAKGDAKLEKFVKDLSEHVVVENGNVQIGKNLEVDGAIFAQGKDLVLGGNGDDIVSGDPFTTEPSQNMGFTILTDANGKRRGFIGTKGDDVAGEYKNYYYGVMFELYPLGDSVKAGSFRKTLDGMFEEASAITLNARLKMWRHSLTITCADNTKYYVDLYLKTDLTINDANTLATVTGNHPFGCGSAQAVYDTGTWKIGNTQMTSVSDIVIPLQS